MDFSLIGAASTAISSAREFGKAALAVRDFNQMADIVSKLNDQILKAQDALFTHNAQLLTLQNEHIQTAQKLREMEEALAERGRYTLFELSPGVFAYRMNVLPVASEMSDPLPAEPVHYVCQPCFDKRVKAVLQRHSVTAVRCPVCATIYSLQTPSNRPDTARTDYDPLSGTSGWMGR